MWFKRKQRDQSEKSNVQPAKQKRISARSNSSSDYQDYHDDDEHGIRMVEDLIQETKDVAKEVSSAIKKSVEKKKDTNANPLHKRHNKAHLEGVCTYVPTKEMTGIDADLTRVCATLSGQMYGARSPDSFKLPSKLGVEVVLYKDSSNGHFKGTQSGMAVAIKGSTMMVAWHESKAAVRQTVDVAMDGPFASMASSKAWQHTAPYVRAQGGMLALVENYMSLYEKEIQEEIAKRGIENVVLTGHSLGGGIAQVAHLYLQGECEKAHSDWQAVASKSSLKIHTVAFAAPMTTVNLKRDDGASARFIDQVGQSMCCFVYEMNAVPQEYDSVHFVNEVLKSAIPELVSDIPVPGVLKWAFGAKSKIQDAMESMIEGNKELIGVMVLYRHIGKVIYYKNDETEKGFFYKPRMRNGMGQQIFFRNIKYRKENIETHEKMETFHNEPEPLYNGGFQRNHSQVLSNDIS
mmetsp:Transcript_11643/g.32809  ORF Transcript_11643/g.32809 Transcript_11643/m.32809 type:complete len:462 (-) Transcript_11643:967-2352(-)